MIFRGNKRALNRKKPYTRPDLFFFSIKQRNVAQPTVVN